MPSRRTMSISVPGEVRDRFRDAAAERGVSMSKLVDLALEADPELWRELFPGDRLPRRVAGHSRE